jgi:hypothetical protein
MSFQGDLLTNPETDSGDNLVRPIPSISERKLRSNQRNAQFSTGPTTERGKARSSQNAVKHGLLGQPRSDDAALRSILDGLTADFEPIGTYESMLVTQMARAFWRLDRNFDWDQAPRSAELAPMANRLAMALELVTRIRQKITSVADRRGPLQSLVDPSSSLPVNDLEWDVARTLEASALREIAAWLASSNANGVAQEVEAPSRSTDLSMRYEVHALNQIVKCLDLLRQAQLVRGKTTPWRSARTKCDERERR